MPNFDPPSLVVVDDENKNHGAKLTPEGLQGEKQFFKLLLMVEIFNNYETNQLPIEMIEKFDPIQMFLQAKLFDDIKITQYQDWIRKYIRSKINKYKEEGSLQSYSKASKDIRNSNITTK